MLCLERTTPQVGSTQKEGDLYRVVTAFGKTFELRYGYYDDGDRAYPPVVIYPDFAGDPLYSDEGLPFATIVQDACEWYLGSGPRNEDSTCSDCRYFERGEDWFGLCQCLENRKDREDQ